MKNLLLFFSAILFTITVHAQITDGLVAYYPLNGNANDSSGNNNNGTVNGMIDTADRKGMSHAAFYFDGSAGNIQVPRSIEDDFTISFWFKTTQSAGGGSQWYQGKGMISAELCGVTNDWGISLINGGKICVGIGNPDVTIISPLNYNDGAWHYVAIRRNKTTAFVELFVDDVLAASGNTINTNSLNAPPGIKFGNDFCNASALYNGALDEVKFYNRLLADAEIDSLANLFPVATMINRHTWEGDTTNPVMNVRVSLNHTYSNNITFNYTTADSSAKASIDYIATSGTVIFKPGQINKLIPVTIISNTIREKSKCFKMILTNPVNVLLINPSGLERIMNDDTAVNASVVMQVENAQVNKSIISIAPNPAKNMIYITGSPDKNSVIRITDINGKLLMQQKASTGKNSINISAIAPGNYFIYFTIMGKMQAAQFVKM